MPVHPLHLAVSALIRQVASDVIMPALRCPESLGVVEKSPGELVTWADRETETRLATGLNLLLPAALVIGEEASDADPALLRRLADPLVWIVDPIDGTSNFARGAPPFGTIIALARAGVTEAAWLYDPSTDRMSHAVRGGGAFIDEQPFRIGEVVVARPIASLATQFMLPSLRTEVVAGFGQHFDLVAIPRCAAEHYPRVALEVNHLAVFQRTLPWDHAAGALFLTEAGGVVSRWDGSPYRFADDGTGLLAASHHAVWRTALSCMKAVGGVDGHRRLLPQSLVAASR